MLLLCINFAPELAGIAPYTSALANHLAESVDVNVVTTYPHYPEWKKRDAPKTEFVLSKTGFALGLQRVWHYLPKKMNFVSRFLMEISFAFTSIGAKWAEDDLVVVVSPSLIASLAGLLKAKLTRPRVRRVLWVQDLYSAGLIQKYGPVSPIAVFFRGVERLAVRLADRVVVIHPRFAHFAQESLLADPEKIAVVRNWSHFSVQANESSDSVRRRYGIDLSAILVCHAGNMGFKQALSNVVSAAKLALEQGVGTEFLLVGNGNQRLDLENQAAGLSNLRFIDSVPDVELANLLAAADVLLINELSGMREMALPSKFTTYLTAGKPILLASDKESIMAEELALSGSGIRVEAESPQALVDGISKLISGGDDIGQLVRNGKDFQKKYLSEEAALNAFMQILG